MVVQPIEWSEIPKPDGSDVKEVYAFFGLCSYSAQVLEQGLIILAVGLHAKGLSPLNRGDVEAACEKMEQRTLGQLIRVVEKYLAVPEDLEEALGKVLRDRNYLAHRFFAVHDVDFASSPGRTAMIEELRQMTARFRAADRLVDSITYPLWERLGITQAMIDREMAKKEKEAGDREASH